MLLLAIALGRPALVALAVPFVLGTGTALLRRPTSAPQVALRLPTHALAEGQPLTATVTMETENRLDVARLGCRVSHGMSLLGAAPNRSAVIGRGEVAELDLRVRATRWGRRHVGPVVLTATACDGLMVCEPQVAPPEGVSVSPVAERFVASDAVPRATGVVGSHRSRLPGEGGELAGVRRFAAGDRLRRIDWRVTLRAREMYVTSTYSERETDVVVLLDVLHEAGRSGGIDGAASSLDTTVRAAAALAEHYTGRGDRVGAVEYGARLRYLPPLAGRPQYRRILDWLLDVRVLPEGRDAGVRLLGPRILPPGALILVLTPLLDERMTAILATLAQRGQSVVAVDTLPSDVRADEGGPWSQVAWRLFVMQREAVIGQLREVGVPVERWAGAGSLDVVLRDVSRMATARGVVGR